MRLSTITKYIAAMGLSLLGLPLFAQGIMPEGSGTSADPYRISSVENMLWLAETVDQGNSLSDAYFIQTQDIDFSSTKDMPEGWPCIGGMKPLNGVLVKLPFSGYYDGKGYSIDNLYIKRDKEFQGLFGYVFGGSIKNLNFRKAHVEAKENLAVLAGYAFEEEIINCHVYESEVNGSSIYAGGLLGYQSAGLTQKCTVDADVKGFEYVGGLTAWAQDATIKECLTRGSASSKPFAPGELPGRLVGGLVGMSNSSIISSSAGYVSVEGGNQIGGLIGTTVKSTISQCYAVSAHVKGITYVGGLIGKNEETTVSDCFARCPVEGDNSVGGFIGSLDYSGSDVAKCYAAGTVAAADESTRGAFVGNKSTTTTIAACYFDKDLAQGLEGVGGFSQNDAVCEGKTTREMKDKATYPSWDFVHIWTCDEGQNDGYPWLLALKPVGNEPIMAPHSLTEMRIAKQGALYRLACAEEIHAVTLYDAGGQLLQLVPAHGERQIEFCLSDSNPHAIIVCCQLLNGQTITTKIM